MYITDMSAFYVLTGQVTYRMSQPITAWLSIGSTYSYLTALRINAIKRDMEPEPISQAYQHSCHHEVDGQHSISTVKENEGGLHLSLIHI